MLYKTCKWAGIAIVTLVAIIGAHLFKVILNHLD